MYMKVEDKESQNSELETLEVSVYNDDVTEGSLMSWLTKMHSDNGVLKEKKADAEINAEDVGFQRVNITGEEYFSITNDEKFRISHAILSCLCLRQKYMVMSLQDFNRTTMRYMKWIENSKTISELFDKIKNIDMNIQLNTPKLSKRDSEFLDMEKDVDIWPITFKIEKGVIQLETSSEISALFVHITNIIDTIPKLKRSEFISDFKFIKNIMADGPIKSFAFKRLSFIYSKFQMHTLLNGDIEAQEQKHVHHRDFYNVRKVDNHIHASSSMNQKHLLRFIKRSVKNYPSMKVFLDKKTNKELCLGEVFEGLGISSYELNIDNLDVHADSNTFHRFDKFNLKYNPIGAGELREVFLKTSNLCNGFFFAGLIKELLIELEESKYQYTEMRLSIYGKSYDEWLELAKWAQTHEVKSTQNIWIIQIPRLYDVYKIKGIITSFQDILNNIFMPLFEVTVNPNAFPELNKFLANVAAFDSVDDESKLEMGPMYKNIEKPDLWVSDENPPYDYYLYYIFANLVKLNHLRKSRHMNTFKLRPHCGESGHIYHLISGFLLSENINHGLLLRKSPSLQYLYYLCQVGLSMSPLSNNSLFLNYHRNPLPDFLAKGLKIAISTDDPLQFHFTKEPLMEEYSAAAQVWKLTSTDMCELARNSILMSGFETKIKEHWLGRNFENEGVEGNDISLTNVPNVRIAFRQETLVGELVNLLISIVGSDSSIVMKRKPK